MKIELWEDIVCSWCGISNERVNKALELFEHGDEVELVHRSFMLSPEMPLGQPQPFIEHMAERGISEQQAHQMSAPLQQLAQEVGLPEYHVTDNNVGNTSLAHEFLAWATAQGKEDDAWQLLFRSHFVHKAALWTIEDLLPFADQLGLDPEAARAALESREYRQQVEADYNEALSLGARGVPFLVIDRKYGVSGAQKVELLVQALNQAWAEREAATEGAQA